MNYNSKAELLETINKKSTLFVQEFSDLKNADKDQLVPDVDRTPAQMISYQIGWMQLLQDWERQERDGEKPVLPSAKYKWNELGKLNESFYRSYKKESLTRLLSLFESEVEKLTTWIDTLSETELFEQGHRTWTGDKPHWPLAHWIHVNTVAPFTSFRAKIRKWKKNYE